jgi:hypothetical protein
MATNTGRFSYVNEGSYATYADFDSFPYRCISYLMENDETIWKLLKYSTPDAWNKTDLTLAEKRALIYNGEDDSSKFRVFMDMGQSDVETQEVSLIRIHPYELFPENRTVGSMKIMFEVYTHYKVNHLSNYKTRNDMIIGRFIKLFNGLQIAGIGKLHFDVMGTYGTRMETGGQLPMKGKWILMGNKSD